MHAAVVRAFDRPPRYERYDSPVPVGPDQTVVEVLAAGLHPRVRTDASGRHYTSTGTLPMIPGIDGVGRLPDGRRAYFVAPDGAWGSMAEQAVVDVRRMLLLPEEADAVKVAAGMNPAMSSWVALRRRVPVQKGQAVLVLGATGSAGMMAVQVAKHLGAGRVIGAGRDPARLAALSQTGADETVPLGDDAELAADKLAAAAADVDIVIDYLWGQPASAAMVALLKRRSDPSRALDWVQIGSVAGPTINLPSVALRSANLRIQGNGQGAVSPAAYIAELPSLVGEITAGTITVNPRPLPLASVETAWADPDIPGQRTVLIP